MHKNWIERHGGSLISPPGMIFREIGGCAEANKCADATLTVNRLRGIRQCFLDAYDRGLKTERWHSYRGFAAFLETSVPYIKRLLNKHPNDEQDAKRIVYYVANMQIGDLLRCAGKLQISLDMGDESQQRIAEQVVRAIVQRMRRERRRTSRSAHEGNWHVSEDEAETIWQCAQQIGYIDDCTANEATSWTSWLLDQEKRVLAQQSLIRSENLLPTLVSLGDFLIIWPYLPLFENWLVDNLERIYELPSVDPSLKTKVAVFIGKFAEVKELLNAFTESKTLDDVAAKMGLRSSQAVKFRLESVNLKPGDFHNSTCLGHLILQSPILKPLFVELLCPWECDAQPKAPDRRNKI